MWTTNGEGIALIHIQNINKPSTIYFSFDEVLVSGLRSIYIAVAYATKSGCQELVRSIVNTVGEEEWSKCDKEFIVSVDYGHTEPLALEYLRGLDNSTVRIANSHLLTTGHLRPSSAFHPKFYAFVYDEHIGISSGSANLTKAAFHKNAEVVSTELFERGKSNLDEIWEVAANSTCQLTDEHLETYRNLRSIVKRTLPPATDSTHSESAEDVAVDQEQKFASESAELPASPKYDDVGFPWLWGAIDSRSRAFQPDLYDNFWISAGSMSSSESNNQLELGRGSNLFFGFSYKSFVSKGKAVRLGQMRIRLNGNIYDDAARVYKWHPNNMMERVNLPTFNMANVDYKDKCLLFRRKSNFFELRVADWDSEEAILWRNASSSLNARFSIAKNNRKSRNCGFF